MRKDCSCRAWLCDKKDASCRCAEVHSSSYKNFQLTVQGGSMKGHRGRFNQCSCGSGWCWRRVGGFVNQSPVRSFARLQRGLA